MKTLLWLLLVGLISMQLVAAASFSNSTYNATGSNTFLNITGATINADSHETGSNYILFQNVSYNVTGANFSFPMVNFTDANSITYSWQLPNISSSSGNLITVLNGLSQNVSNVTITTGTNSIVPSSPKLTFPDGSSNYPASALDNTTNLTTLTVPSLPPGLTNLTLSTTCGDGLVTGTEQCDLGGGTNGGCPAACSSSCTVNVCNVVTTAGGGSGGSGSGGASINGSNVSNSTVSLPGTILNQSLSVTSSVNTSTGSLSLTIDSGTYAPGDTVTGSLQISDNSTTPGSLMYQLVDPRGNKYAPVTVLLLPGLSTKLLNYTLPAQALLGTWTIQAVLSHDGQAPVSVSRDFIVKTSVLGNPSGVVIAVILAGGLLFVFGVGMVTASLIRKRPSNRGPARVVRRKDPWE